MENVIEDSEELKAALSPFEENNSLKKAGQLCCC